MNNVSSECLFHYTKNLDTVISIINNGFYPRVVVEDVSFRFPNYESAKLGIPMVCFTDLPEELSEKHRSEYGAFGIGMKKQWGIRNKLNPVAYMIDGTELCEAFNQIQSILKFFEMKNMQNNEYGEAVIAALRMGAYMKLYCNCNNSAENCSKVYYDEREWRYVPPLQVNKDSLNCLIEPLLSSENIEKLNLVMERDYSFKFDSGDVAKLLIPENDVSDFIYKLHESTDDSEKYIALIKTYK